jgi:hypothetical protein
MRNYYAYKDVMDKAGLSSHPRQAARRIQKYPNHFITIDNKLFISKQYAAFILHCRETDEQLMALKSIEVNGEITNQDFELLNEELKKGAYNG